MVKDLPERWLDAQTMSVGPEGDKRTMIRYMAADKTVRIIEPPFKPYFFIAKQQVKRCQNLLDQYTAEVEEGRFVSTTGMPLSKISVPSIEHIGTRAQPGLRDALDNAYITTFESDVPFVDRVMLDCNIKQCDIEHKAYLDIEVEALHEFPEPQKAEHRIISIAVVGNDENEYFISDNDEYKMFKELSSLLKRKYQMVTGWNLKKFDWDYLRNRAHRLHTRFDHFGIQEIDAMMNYRKIAILGYGGEGYSLEAVAEKHLGVGVESNKIPITTQEMWDSFMGDRERLKEYNLQDSRLVMKLDKILNLCAPYVQICERVPLMLRDTPLMTKVWEHMLMRGVLEGPTRLVFPRRTKQEAELQGGYTFEPTAGVYQNVMVLDYNALYPSIMNTFELSPELVGLYSAWKQSHVPLDRWINKVFGGEAACEDGPDNQENPSQ